MVSLVPGRSEVQEGLAGARVLGEHVAQALQHLAPDLLEWNLDVHLPDRLGARGVEARDLVGDDLAAIVGQVEAARHDHRLATHDDRLVPPVGIRPGDHLDHALASSSRNVA